MSRNLTLWVIYDHPIDYPHHYVARRHFVGQDGQTGVDATAILSPSLEKLRESIPPGLHCLGRDPHDDATMSPSNAS